MKNWIQAWKVSRALDSMHGKKPYAACLDALSLNAIHERLSCSKPAIEPPEDLHSTIMTAVRRQSGKTSFMPGRSVFFDMLLSRSGAAACLMVALIGIGVMLWTGRAQLEAIQNAQPQIQLSPELASTLQILNSLDQEMEHLDHDLRNTANHLFASLP